MFTNSNNGEWFVTVVDANVVKGFDLFSKSDLYVELKYNGKTFKTKTAKNQDVPVWNETFSFPFQANDRHHMEIIISDIDLFINDKITAANISSDKFPEFGEEKEYSIPLSYKNQDIGILHIRIRNDGKNFHGANTENYQSTSYDNTSFNNNSNMLNTTTPAMGNIGSGGYNSTVLGGDRFGGSDANNRNNFMTNNNNNFMTNNVSNDSTLGGTSLLDNGNSHIVSHTITEQRFIDTSINPNVNDDNISSPFGKNYNNNNINTSANIGNTHNYNQNDNISHVANIPFDNNNIINNNLPGATSDTNYNTSTATTDGAGATVGTLPELTRQEEMTPINTTTLTSETDRPITNMVPSTEITKTKKKRSGLNKLRLPEKYHHYEDGHTSSSSESSNEGEKRRAAQGKLGQFDADTAPTNTYHSDINDNYNDNKATY